MKYLTQVVYTYTICEIILPRRLNRRGKIVFILTLMAMIVLTHFNLEVLGCHAAAI